MNFYGKTNADIFNDRCGHYYFSRADNRTIFIHFLDAAPWFPISEKRGGKIKGAAQKIVLFSVYLCPAGRKVIFEIVGMTILYRKSQQETGLNQTFCTAPIFKGC